MKSSEKLWARLRDYSLIVVGSLIQAAALRIFLVPAKLASGGVSGIAQIIHHYTDWPIGVMVLIGNIPLFLLGWRFLGGRRFAVRTALAIVAYSLAVDLLLLLPFFPKNGLTDDIFLNSLYGAVVSGIGYGLVYRARGTSGGSDILARILNHWRGVPMTQSYLMVDSVVILAAGFAFGWKEALYAIVTLYVSGLAAETVLEGGGTVRTAMIVTAKPREIADAILVELERGVTTLAGTGAYTGEDRPVLYCVVSRAEIAQIKAIVQETDPRAFMVVGVAHEALGEGFKELKRA
ncbi:MAG: membrane protein [Anaerolineaceae bacterium]|nr:YitT family protein [Anaerolineae bacterium]MBL1171134.1 YitT family protein [Chloroflexota bacterium]WKZ53870.1 MAG: YitT family protein [Anaerolineales bacterium]GJQ38811.1 MAG: membrane protein [Anaerolineaceae bacterium]NOG74590.1 YitT family protein [Chloroflexota bacterium]